MGCDIHMVYERRKSDREAWLGVVAVDCIKVSARPRCDDRDYEFFAALAGVRGMGPAPLGCPLDMSELARAQVALIGPDGHSRSYKLARDFCDAFRRGNGNATKLTDDEIMGVYMEDDEQWRVVFWFDN